MIGITLMRTAKLYRELRNKTLPRSNGFFKHRATEAGDSDFPLAYRIQF